jgi:hypothetical protein
VRPGTTGAHDLTRRAHVGWEQTEARSRKGARAVNGSGPCRRKARHEDRHTSDGVCAVAF